MAAPAVRPADLRVCARIRMDVNYAFGQADAVTPAHRTTSMWRAVDHSTRSDPDEVRRGARAIAIDRACTGRERNGAGPAVVWRRLEWARLLPPRLVAVPRAGKNLDATAKPSS